MDQAKPGPPIARTRPRRIWEQISDENPALGNVVHQLTTLSIPESTGLGGNNISDENPALGNVSMVNVATNQTALLLQAAEN